MNIQHTPDAKADRVSADSYLPLEFTKNYHVCLWSIDGSHKWTIGYFIVDNEEPDFMFVGARPFDERVNWDHFKKIVEFGYTYTKHHSDKFYTDIIADEPLLAD